MIKRVYSKRLKKQVWAYDLRINGQRLRDSGFATRQECQEVVDHLRQAARQQEYGLSPRHSPTLAALIEKRLPTITRPHEHQRSRRVLHTWLSLLPDQIRITSLTTADVRRFVEQRQADGQAASSINRELNILAATLHSAKEFFPALSQWIAPPMPRPKIAQRRRERLITSEERERILSWLLAERRPDEEQREAAARQRVGQILRFALLTAMRHGEINQMRWAQIDWQQRTLKVIGTKTDSIRYIPITDSMMEILQARKQVAGKNEFVFTRSGQPASKLYRILERACADLGIPYGKKTAGGFVVHDARHTAATIMLQSGLDLATVGSITGHTDKTLVLYYSHATLESRQRAMAALENADAA